MTKSEAPGFLKGLAGPLLEPYYLVFGDAMVCPDCGERWKGYYAQHLNYCQFCGVELVAETDHSRTTTEDN